MRAGNELHAAVDQGRLLQRHPDAQGLVGKGRIPVGLVLVPGRGGPLRGRLADGMLFAPLGVRAEQLAGDFEGREPEGRFVQLGGMRRRVHQLRQTRPGGRIVGAGQVELLAAVPAHALGEEAVIDLADPGDFRGLGQPLEAEITLLVELRHLFVAQLGIAIRHGHDSWSLRRIRPILRH